jgi:hypothetical protein
MFYPISSGPPEHLPPYDPAPSITSQLRHSPLRPAAESSRGRDDSAIPKVSFGPRPKFRFPMRGGFHRLPVIGPYFAFERGNPNRRRAQINQLMRRP